MNDAQLILPLLLVPLLAAGLCYVILHMDRRDREALRKEQERLRQRLTHKVRYCLRRRRIA